jgi:C1A family cysteine protease
MKTSLYSTSSWKRQGVALMGLAALLTLCGPSRVYAQLSASDIAAIRQEITNQNYTFTVAENPATQRPLSQLCGYIPSLAAKSANSLSSKPMMAGANLPSYWDWRQHNGVTPVKDQGNCGSCWAFSTVGTMEAMILIASGTTTDLSEQQLVSCDTEYYGCDGGNWAFDMEISPGAVLESCFPYQAADVPCQTDCPYVYQLTSWGYVGNSSSVPSVDAIKNAIYTYGPISVAVAVDGYFQAYTGGVFDDNTAYDINHAVVLVGWDDTNGCWIMKNSWGTGWGESGYMRIAYGCDQIGYSAAYAVWVPPEPLWIAPANGFSSIGGVRGPFTITSQSLSLTNAGTNSLTWTLVNTSLWLNASTNGGTLTPDGPAATVTVSLNSVASNLVVGTYSATLWFTNLNDNFGQSRQFNLSVISPPTITAQPANQAVLDGATAMFTVGVTGGLPMYYQWQFNGTNLTDGGNISGSATANLTVSDVTSTDVGAYSIIVSNMAGLEVSSNALLTITPSPPVIVQQPTNQAVPVGDVAQFIVGAVGSKPFFYQWYSNGIPLVDGGDISGSATALLTIMDVQTNDVGPYSVTITNTYGSVTSSNAVLTTIPCYPVPSGIVSWWPGDGNANDIIGTNNGILAPDVTFGPAEVGQGFQLNDTNAYILVPASATLNVGTNSGLTVEAWIYPTNPASGFHYVFDWNKGILHGDGGVYLCINPQPGNSGVLGGDVRDTSERDHMIYSASGTVVANSFQHVALTYDYASGNAVLYLNGVVVGQQNVGSVVPLTSYNLFFGESLGSSPGDSTYGNFFGGVIDAPSVYNRALTSNEIAAIYAAGSAGKCPPPPTPPTITMQPTNQTVEVGGVASFSVSASGTPPLSYQWEFDGTNLVGAMNTTLVLTDVQLTQAGNYAVLVTNLYGSVLSSNAQLTVTVPPTNCDPVPSGIVSWWPGDGNANDIIGTNNGILAPDVTFGPAEVGQGFQLNDTNAYILVPASATLNVGTNSGLTVEAWIYPTNPASGFHYVFDWNKGILHGDGGVYLCINPQPGNSGVLGGDVRDTSERDHMIYSASGTVVANSFQHVALTYDYASGNAVLYLNGVVVGQQNVGSVVPLTSYPLFLGEAVGSSPGDSTYGNFFGGVIDAPSVYNRALTSNEIAAIYSAGSGGKCVPQPPVITSQPTNQTVVVGGVASFSVSASGSSPLSYQWSFDTTNILRATNAMLTLTNVQLTQAGNYAVLVTNRYGAILSSNATLTVTVPPPNCDPVPSGIVSWWPGEGNGNDIIGTNNGILSSGVAFAPGEVGLAFLLNSTNAYFDVPASSSLNVGLGGGLTLEGWINISNVDGLHPICEWNNGVSDFGIVIGVQLWVGQTPSSQGVLCATFMDTNGNNSIQVASPSNALVANVFQYVAVTYDQASGFISLYVNGQMVTNQQWGNYNPLTCYDLWVGRRPQDCGGGCPTDGTYLGGLLDELSLYNRALSSNEIAAIYNAGSAGKCVTPTAPVITSQPANQAVVMGGVASFSVTAGGTPPLSYQWEFDGTNLVGATNAALVLTDVQQAQAGNYAVLVTNLYGSVLSSNALLTVLVPPTIITQPTNQTVYVGGTASFSVTAGGTPPLSYQWSFDATNILGATNATLVLTNVLLSQSGSYAVLVTNLYGSVLSSNATLTVLAVPPAITQQPTNQTIFVGGNATFSAAASGTAPLIYQWLFNGTNILGATNTTLTLTNVQLTQAGIYTLQVTNIAGTALSSNAVLTVNPLPSVPVITGFSPRAGVVGASVTIFGTNFSPVAASNTVYMGAVQAGVTAASVTNLTVTVPVSATYAPITVTVNGLTAYANQPFMPTFPGIGQINSSSLAPQVTLATGTHPGQMVIADLDGDGKPDLIVCEGGSSEISIYRNISTNGSLTAGSFAPRVDLPVMPGNGLNPCMIAVADLDGAGKLDIIALDADSNAISIFRNISSPGSITTNSFAPRIDIPAGNTLRGLAVQDLDGDGKPEIITTSQTTPGIVSIFQNMSTIGNIAFAPRVDLPAGNGPSGVAVGDLDGDGKPDLAVANYNSGTISVFHNLISSPGVITTNSFAPRVDFPALASVYPIAIGDMDGDGKLDLVVGGGPGSQAIAVYRNTSTVGSITTNSFAPGVVFAAGGWVNAVALGDLDGDGRLDIALVCQASSVFSLFKNVSTPGSFTTNSLAGRVDYAAGSNPNGVAVGDLDGDGRPDIVFANDYDNTVSIYRNIVPFGGPPVITSQPTNQTVVVGGTASFSVTASGTPPLCYQWNFNGTNLVGATNSSLVLTNVQFSQAGNYAVLVTNLYGSVLSSNATLTVNAAPVITTQPANQTNFVGTTAIFTVVAVGSTPLSYQWNFNGTNLFAATNTSLMLTNIRLNQAGNYVVLVTNLYGSVMSSNAALVVNPLFRFVWNQIPSPRFAGAPFAVTVQAQNLTNGLATNFTGTVVLLTTNGVPVSPATSGNFSQGIWTGTVTIVPTGTNLVLEASDSYGENGLANPINVVSLPALTTVPSGSTLYILWPVDPSEFVLETSPDLSPGSWVPVTAPPVNIGNQYLEPITMSGATAFYRLRFTGP